MIYTNSSGQVIGQLRDGVFRKVVKQSKHLLKILDAWGIDKAVIMDIEGKCNEIRIKESESGTVYSCPFNTFIANCIEKDFVGPQLFLPRKHFTQS